MKLVRMILFLLIGVCLLVSIVMVGIVIDPDVVLSYVYGSTSEGRKTDHLDLGPSRSDDQYPPEGWVEFRSEEYGFQIRYPESVTSKTVINRQGLNAGMGADSDTPVWEFALDDSRYYQGTNLLKASLVINVSHNPEAVSECSQFMQGSLIKAKEEGINTPPVIKINGISFRKDRVLEGAMGEIYEKITYRTIHENACYQITLLLQTQNIHAFAEGEINEVPRKKVIQKLSSVAATFEFLDVTPTFPKQPLPVLPDSVSKAIDKATDGYVDGIDVSHWQGDINWVKVEGAGYKFAFAKATEGVGFTDWTFVENTENGTDAGVLMGAYHFARPDLNNTGAEEAEWFLSVTGDYIEAGYLRPVLDLEVSGDLGKDELSAWVVEWMETVKDETGVEPLLYTNYYYIWDKLNNSVTGYDLWIAYWTCDPTPTHDIPPTGGFADWDFWQYQAPGGCGYFSIPGIKESVDLDIFNGIEEELVSFESDAPLWVSLRSDAYRAPYPYFADLTADVNGSATGPMDIAFWWDCSELGNDINDVMRVCGRLPIPDPGECAKNESGMKCNSVVDENQLAEFTYVEIGDYTPKVIVERGEEVPAEDRYLINVINPIRSIEANPLSPAESLINHPFLLSVDVKVDTSVAGALQVEIIEDDGEVVKDQSCISVAHDENAVKAFDLEITESEMAMKVYKIWARYRAYRECPVEDISPDDRSQSYQITWGLPEIDVQGNLQSIESGSNAAQMGDGTDFGAALVDGGAVTHAFSIINEGDVSLSLTGTPYVSVEGLNASDFSVIIQPTSPVPGEGESTYFEVKFDPTQIGLRTAIISIENNDDDENPYTFHVQGLGTTLDKTLADFDGDGDTDISVYRPSNGYWYMRGASPVWWGMPDDLPVPGDYDGDGVMDIAVYRPKNGKWFIFDDSQGEWWGMPGDIPVQGDYTGDGVTDLAVYRPSNGKWYVKGEAPIWWGLSGDIPVPGDYDGDGITDIAVYRPSNGKWYIYGQTSGIISQSGAIPIPGDYDGDGIDDIAVYQPSDSRWYMKGELPTEWGESGDIPVPGDYDGDGDTDIAVVRPSDGKWYIKDQMNVWYYILNDYPLPVRDTNADGDPYE